MHWRIYYGDGSTFTGTKPADRWAAPPLDVQCIVQPDPRVGRLVMCKWDWYYWVDPDLLPGGGGPWWGSDIWGLLDQLLHNPRAISAVKQGRHSPRFTEILEAATTDPDFPVKSAAIPTVEVGS